MAVDWGDWCFQMQFTATKPGSHWNSVHQRGRQQKGEHCAHEPAGTTRHDADPSESWERDGLPDPSRAQSRAPPPPKGTNRSPRVEGGGGVSLGRLLRLLGLTGYPPAPPPPP